MKILFVCSGNTCRSPMAAALASEFFKSEGRDDLADSAGIFASDGDAASGYAVEAMREHGIDISNHRAKRLTPEIAENADIIIPMTDSHEQMLKTVGIDDSKIRRIGEIPDPFGRGIEVYFNCANELEKAVQTL